MLLDLDSIENRNIELIDRISKIILKPMTDYHRAEINGLDNVPPGKALIVGNHNSAPFSVDSFIFCGYLYHKLGEDYLPYGLAHESFSHIPLLNNVIAWLGGVRANPENAHKLFEKGYKVLVYPGGEMEAMRPFAQRNKVDFGGRQGYIRLALKENVPIVPVASHGAHSVYYVIDDCKWLVKLLKLDEKFSLHAFPLTISFPLGLTLGPVPFFIPFPAKMKMEILEPIYFPEHSEEEIEDETLIARYAQQVEDTLQKSLDKLAAAEL